MDGNVFWRCRERESGWIHGLTPSAPPGWDSLAVLLKWESSCSLPHPGRDEASGATPCSAVVAATKQEVAQSQAGAYGALPWPVCSCTSERGWDTCLTTPEGLESSVQSATPLDRSQLSWQSAGGPSEGGQWPPAAPAPQRGLSSPSRNGPRSMSLCCLGH